MSSAFSTFFVLRFQFSKPAAFRQLDYSTKLSILCQALFSPFLSPVHFRAAVKTSPKGCRFATAYLYYHLHPKLSSIFFFIYESKVSLSKLNPVWHFFVSVVIYRKRITAFGQAVSPKTRMPSNACLAALVYFELFLQRAMIPTIRIPNWIKSENVTVVIYPATNSFSLLPFHPP